MCAVAVTVIVDGLLLFFLKDLPDKIATWDPKAGPAMSSVKAWAFVLVSLLVFVLVYRVSTKLLRRS